MLKIVLDNGAHHDDVVMTRENAEDVYKKYNNLVFDEIAKSEHKDRMLVEKVLISWLGETMDNKLKKLCRLV